MRYVLDTNIVSAILRGNVEVIKIMQQVIASGDQLWSCPVVLFEVKRGLHARDSRRLMRSAEALFARFISDDYTGADWELAAQLWAQRRTQGMPVADADLLIAVFARNRDAVLVTDNEKDFDDLGVTVENWTKA